MVAYFLPALYLSQQVIGLGYGKQLLSLAEERASALGLSEIFLDATLNALDFYKSQEFKVVNPDKGVVISGERIRCVGMSKIL